MSGTKYPKGVARTEEILDIALRVVAEQGYTRTTIRQLAEEVGLSKTGLLHHFGTKEALFAEILRRRDLGDEATMDAAGGERREVRFSHLPQISARVPGLVQLYTRFSAEATDPEHGAHAYFVDRYERSRALMSEVLSDLQADGRLTPTVDPLLLATALIAMLDGLQVQWLYDDDIDMSGAVEAMLALVGLDAASRE